MHVVGRAEGYAGFSRKADKLIENSHLLGKIVAHYLDEIILAENPAVTQRDLFCGIEITRRKRARDLARQTRRKADKPLAVLAEQLKIYARAAVKALDIRKRSQFREVVVAGFVLAEKYQMKRALVRVFIKARIFGNVDLAADHRLYADLFAGVVKLYRREKIAVVGDGAGFLTQRFCGGGKLFHAAGAVEKRIFAMNVKMNKIRHFSPSAPRSSCAIFASFCRRWLAPEREMGGSSAAPRSPRL